MKHCAFFFQKYLVCPHLCITSRHISRKDNWKHFPDFPLQDFVARVAFPVWTVSVCTVSHHDSLLHCNKLQHFAFMHWLCVVHTALDDALHFALCTGHCAHSPRNLPEIYPVFPAMCCIWHWTVTRLNDECDTEHCNVTELNMQCALWLGFTMHCAVWVCTVTGLSM